MSEMESNGIVYTLKAKCRDCYRCVKVCPVKAIGVRSGQAYVEQSRCIVCGACIRECPQGAKTYRNDVGWVKMLLEKNNKVVASIAPSFASVYSGWRANRLPAALRKLGFAHVAETAEGACHIAQRTIDYVADTKTTSITSCCPAFINYVEKYRPDALGSLVPLVSPMVAHAKILKQRLGSDIKVIFIGPCIAKKFEADRDEYKEFVDCVLTFEELDEWLDAESIMLENCEESGFDFHKFAAPAALFPLPGGVMKVEGVEGNEISFAFLHTSGHEKMDDLLSTAVKTKYTELIEYMFCSEGCVNGPAVRTKHNLFARFEKIVDYSRHTKIKLTMGENLQYLDFSAGYNVETALPVIKFTEKDILSIFEMTGKADPVHQLNCGACGYESCRENAIAVFSGMAEPEMCIPYMRRLAEYRSDKIIQTSPNGIVTLDANFRIISMNQAFRKYFMCSDETVGRRISYLFDSKGYDELAARGSDMYEAVVEFNGRQYHEMIYSIDSDQQYVGMYIDINGIKMDENKIDRLKTQAIKQTRELLDHQIRMTQDMAVFLGEYTAKSEELFWKLMSVYKNEE